MENNELLCKDKKHNIDPDNLKTGILITVGFLTAIFAAIVLVLLGVNSKPIHKKYAEEIAKIINVKATEYSYTYERAENHVSAKTVEQIYLIDFYTWQSSDTYSKWLCYIDKTTKNINCEQLYIEYL